MNIKSSITENSQSVEFSGKILSKDVLATFLEDTRLGENTLSLPQAEGFMFALACCPKPVKEIDWLPVILGDALLLDGAAAVVDAGTEEELNPEEAVALEELFQGVEPKPPRLTDVCSTLMQMLENTERIVIAGLYQIPVEYAFSWDTSERVPMEQWCEGMLLADQWLEPFWIHGLARLNRTDPWAYAKLVEELDETLALIGLLADIDAGLDKLERNPEDDWMQLRQEIKDSYDTIDRYLLRYMNAGNGLASYFVLRKPQVRERPKVGRNELCPCGSGLKYKKCCISAEN